MAATQGRKPPIVAPGDRRVTFLLPLQAAFETAAWLLYYPKRKAPPATRTPETPGA